MSALTRLVLPRTLAVIPKDRLAHLKETSKDLKKHKLIAEYTTAYLQMHDFLKKEPLKITTPHKTPITDHQKANPIGPSLASKAIRILREPHKAAFFRLYSPYNRLSSRLLIKNPPKPSYPKSSAF